MAYGETTTALTGSRAPVLEPEARDALPVGLDGADRALEHGHAGPGEQAA